MGTLFYCPFFKKFEAELIYNALLVSGVQHSNSDIYNYFLDSFSL